MNNLNIKNSIKILWEDTLLEMFPSRSLFVHKTKELLISDIHLGKGEYFQQNGIPLTNEGDKANFDKIYKLINKFSPNKLIILGDLFHSKDSISHDLKNKIKELTTCYKNKIIFVEGNHDRGCLIDNITYLKNKKSLNLIYSHEPLNRKKGNILNICGHYHPQYLLKDFKDKVSLRCFALDKYKNTLYLPAFGDLTGGHFCKREFQKWGIISENNIFEIK